MECLWKTGLCFFWGGEGFGVGGRRGRGRKGVHIHGVCPHAQQSIRIRDCVRPYVRLSSSVFFRLTLRTCSLMMLATMSETEASGAPIAITSSLAILKLCWSFSIFIALLHGLVLVYFVLGL